MELLLDHLGTGIFYIILISMPIVLVAALIGLVVGILQAVTQVQEQTIAAAPKILGVFLVLLVGGGLILRIMNDYLEDSISLAVDVIPKNEYFALTPVDQRGEDPNKRRFDFFNDKKFVRKKDKPKFKELINKPLDSPYLKNKKEKSPDVFTPAPPIPDANISEEIQNYKNMRKANKKLRSSPGIEQKAPIIPPLSKPNTNPSISVLPNLDEPPAIDPSDIQSSPRIASNNGGTKSAVTGAAAYAAPVGIHKFDSTTKGSTIIINGDENNVAFVKKSNNNLKNISKKGVTILEAE